MATVNIAAGIKATGWGDRRPEYMITSAVLQSDILQSFTIIEGVKSKAQIPIQDASIAFGTDMCDLTKTNGTLTLGEKEVSVAPVTWYFSNCQTALFDTYRSQMLRKGVNTQETLDVDLKNWLFDHFVKLNAQNLLTKAATSIKALIATDTDVINVAPTASEPVLTTLKKMYMAMPKDLLNQIAGVTDAEYRPVIYMNAVKLREYIIAVAEKNSTNVYAMESQLIPSYLGMEVKLFPTLGDNDILITQPSNLLFITDDMADSSAINARFDELKSTDEFYGKYLVGFNYRDGKKIVKHIGA